MPSSERVRQSRQEHPDASRVRPAHAQTAGTVRNLPGELLALQRMAGNRAVVSLLTVRDAKTELGLQPAPVVQRLFTPEDVSSEMVGQRFQVTEAFTAGSITVAAGGQVEIVAWANASSTVQAHLPLPAPDTTPFDIPKRILRPVHPAAGGLSQYGTNIGATVKDMEAGQKKMDAELARRGGPRPGEIPRLEGLQKKRERFLNEKLIQETMINRFDPIIQSWTAHYNALRTGADKLDPNLVKSLLFQESEMGSAGKYLDLPDPIRTRFNIGQTIDSWPDQQLIMIREVQPALIGKYHLASIEADLTQAKTELKHLSRPGHPTAAEQARHDELQAQSQGNWQPFFIGYRAAGQTKGFAEAIGEFFATHDPGKPNRNLDYEFWIQTTIRWLFEKRKHAASWPDAIRAYNGSGAAANTYRDAVTRRASDAAADEAAGTEFVPTR